MSSPGNSKTDIAEDCNVSCFWCGLPPSAPVTIHKYFCENMILKQNQRCPCGTEPVTVVALQLVPLPPSVDSHRFVGSCPFNIPSFSLCLVSDFFLRKVQRLREWGLFICPHPLGLEELWNQVPGQKAARLSPDILHTLLSCQPFAQLPDSPSLPKGWAACLCQLLHYSSFYHQGSLSIHTWRTSWWRSFTVATFHRSVLRQPGHTVLWSTSASGTSGSGLATPG